MYKIGKVVYEGGYFFSITAQQAHVVITYATDGVHAQLYTYECFLDLRLGSDKRMLARYLCSCIHSFHKACKYAKCRSTQKAHNVEN